MTTGLPFDDFRNLMRELPPRDEAAAETVRSQFGRMRKPTGSLGRLEEIAEWLAGWTGRPPAVTRPLVAIFAGNHGVTRRNLSPRPPEATAQMVEMCAAGGAAINQLCVAHDLGLKVFDLALHLPTADFVEDAALDERGCAATMAFGMEAIAGGIDLACVAGVGIGSNVSAAAIMAAIFGGEPSQWASNEEGAQVVAAALALHGANLKDPLEALRRLGGREIAAMAGAILAARMEKIPVVLDGYAALAAAAILKAAEPTAIDHCILSHISTEPGMALAAKKMGLAPLLYLHLGDGEGMAAALAADLIKNAALIHSGMVIRG